MTLSEEKFAFYFELGLAITQWANVERRLLDILASCTNGKDFNALAHGYFSIESFRAKLQFSNSLMRTKHDNAKHLTRWAALVKEMAQASTLRNTLAHHRVMGFPAANAGQRYVLQPWIEKSDIMSQPRTKKRKQSSSGKPHQSALSVRKIIAVRYRFVALSIALENYAYSLAGESERFPKDLEQPSNPPTIQAIAAQMRAMLSPPPAPLLA